MPATMSSMLVLLSFIVIVVHAAAHYCEPTQCASIASYTGRRAALGKNFTPDSSVCHAAVKKVRNRTPSQNEDMDECKAHLVSHLGTSYDEVKNLVRCPASPDDVWISYDGRGYGIYYVQHRDDTGCDT